MGPESFPEDWRAVLADEFAKPYFGQLVEFLDRQRAHNQVFPPEADVFNAFRLTPFDRVKVSVTRARPISRRRPGARALLLGQAGDQAAAFPGQHLQGAEVGPRLRRSPTTAAWSPGPSEG